MNEGTKRLIQTALSSFSQGNLTQNALKLFQALGYTTDRQAPLSHPTFEAFRESFIPVGSRFDADRAKCKEWKYVDFLFQLTKTEVSRHTSLFDAKQVDRTVIETYLFLVVELDGDHYNRTTLSNITRELNRLFPMPAMILFKHGPSLTLAVIGRRLNSRDVSRDVLEKVTLIKDVNCERPHRAHIEILHDLSFDELLRTHQFTNFVELHNAWQSALDTKELNRRFFQELANWHFYATQRVVFPSDSESDEDIRNATSVIRLITRLIFVWFLKEKRLVPEALFDEKLLRRVLKWKDGKNSTYYKAILQNLFFATLNTEMGKRRFRSKNDVGRDGHFFIHNVFRYQDEFLQPSEMLEKYFAPIPFLNGGLFECLDREDESPVRRRKIRIDGFSDREDNILEVPDELFFCEKEKVVNLNDVYGTKGKQYKVRGLINILNSYKFTIAENTPIEEEVALDPELLGKVFENLLASYNPETKSTARKQTGSFYTPREIVNYMVDESLLACLKQRLEGRSSSTEVESNLRQLLAYSTLPNPFNSHDTELLVDAIDSMKILDPACGSGAFPMGILHKLVHMLHRVDPANQLWKQKQLGKALAIVDPEVRKTAVSAIEDAFERNELDYGRKLFIIENCIYGVDIQPIAVQIAKLRFFISLVVDQQVKSEESHNNYGIRPLPNLETKFVAANTLVELKSENANLFTNLEIDKKKEDLRNVRHEYFEARTPQKKEACRLADRKLRDQLAKLLLVENTLQPESAKRLSAWDPYNQNSSAPFFSPEWMLGLNGGFDLVIGNPPYVRVQQLKHEEIDYYKSDFIFAHKRLDISLLFFERAISLLRANGVLCYISSNQFLVTEYGAKAREELKKLYIRLIVDFGDFQVFENALTYTSVFVISNRSSQEGFEYCKVKSVDDIAMIEKRKEIVDKKGLGDQYWTLDSPGNVNLLDRLQANSSKLFVHAQTHYGVISGNDDILVLDEDTRRSFRIEKEHIRQLVVPQDIDRWKVNEPTKYVIYPYRDDGSKTRIIELRALRSEDPNLYSYLMRHKKELSLRKDSRKTFEGREDWYGLVRFSSLEVFGKEKIITPTIVRNNKFALDRGKHAFAGGKTTVITSEALPLIPLLGLLNSRLAEFFYHSICPVKAGGYFNYSTTFLLELPVKDEFAQNQEIQRRIADIVKFILFDKDNVPRRQFFERLLDAMVYELYLPEAVRTGGCEVFKYLREMPTLEKLGSTASKERSVEKVFAEFSNPGHPIRIAIFKMDVIEEIRMIEARKQP